MAPIDQLNISLAFDRLGPLRAGMYCLSSNDPGENVFGDLSLYPNCYGICPNSNVAGFGVRASFYAQTALGLLLATLGSDYNLSYASMITAMATSICLIVAALYSLSATELTLHHAAIAINLATLPTMTFFAAIFRMRISQRLKKDEAHEQELEQQQQHPAPSDHLDDSETKEPLDSPHETKTARIVEPASPPSPVQPPEDDGPLKPNKYLAFAALFIHFLFCIILFGFVLGLANTRYFPDDLGSSIIEGGLKNIRAAQPQCNEETSIVIFFRDWPLLRPTTIPEYQKLSPVVKGFVMLLYVLLLFAPFFSSFIAVIPLPAKISGGLIDRFNTLSHRVRVSIRLGCLFVMLIWVAIIIAMTEMQITANRVLPGEQELDFGQILPLLLILIPVYQLLGLILELLSKRYGRVHDYVKTTRLHRRFAFQLPPHPDRKHQHASPSMSQRPLSAATYVTANDSPAGSTTNGITTAVDNGATTSQGMHKRGAGQGARASAATTSIANTLTGSVPAGSGEGAGPSRTVPQVDHPEETTIPKP